jgi:hypothetical protein
MDVGTRARGRKDDGRIVESDDGRGGRAGNDSRIDAATHLRGLVDLAVEARVLDARDVWRHDARARAAAD